MYYCCVSLVFRNLFKNLDAFTAYIVAMKRVIFLDVDGVLTMSRCLLCDYEENDPTLVFPHNVSISSDITPLEKKPLSNLKWLVSESSAHIVFSSTWRLDDNMRAFLVAALVSVG